MEPSAGPFAHAGFGANTVNSHHNLNNANAYFYGSGPSPQTHATQPAARAQAFARAPQARYLYNGGHDGAMAPTPTARDMKGQFVDHQYPGSSAPGLPAVSASSLPPAQPVQQSHIASPQQRLSPNAAIHAQVKQQSPLNKYPMAAPPLPQTPGPQYQAATASTASSPTTPQSPGSHGREQQRIALLLDINVELLLEISRLQSEGRGGAGTPQQQAQLKSQGEPAELASDEYLQVLRRIQANLGYLMPKAQNDQQKVPNGPAHMTPPPHMPQLQIRYDHLSELFPEWPGYDRMNFSSASPQPNGIAASPVVATPV